MDTYTFSANVGDYIEIRMADTSEGNTLITRMELYGPSGGNAIAASSNNYVSVISLTITEAGTYTLLAKEVSAYNATTGSYNIYFVKVPGANEHGIVENSTLASETIDQGDLDSYTFSVALGDTMEILVSDSSTGGTLSPCISLYGPGGDLVSSDCDNNAAYVIHTATEDGIYTLVITDSNGTGYGDYKLSYYNDAYPVDYCHNDFDGDNDVDGADLIYFRSEYDTIHIYDLKGLENFAASFGLMDCEE